MPTELTLLAGRYEFVRELGRGATARVILVRDHAGGTLLAAKTVPPEARALLEAELRVLQQIEHEGLARPHELLTVPALGPPFHLTEGTALLIQEWVDGAPLGRTPATWQDALGWGLALSESLGALHAAGVLHGDLQPDNVIVRREDGRPVLIDLGLAGPALADGRLRGTPGFLAPEAWVGVRSVATDLYALGATLLAACAPPEPALTRDWQAALRTVEVPDALAQVLRALVDPEPQRRPASAHELGLRLAAAAGALGRPVEATSTPPAQRALLARRPPHTGHRDIVAELADRIGREPVVRVGGPRGAGRTRAIEEAVAKLQHERRRRGEPSPSFVRDLDAARFDPAAVVPGAVHHLRGEVPATTLQSTLRSLSVGDPHHGTCLVLEVEADADVEVPPLGEDDFATLCGALGVAPRTYARLTGLRAGALCRSVVATLRAGRDLDRDPLVVGDLRVPPSALEDARRLAVAFRLPAGELEGAAELLRAGCASVDDTGTLGLVSQLRDELLRELVPNERARLARGFESAPEESVARAIAGWVAGDPLPLQRAVEREREAGEVALALALVRHTRAFDDGEESAPGWRDEAEADALRALGRYEEAAAVARGPTRQEILRRAGEEVSLDDAAPRTRAWAALQRGALDAAEDALVEVTELAERAEVEAWLWMSRGDLEAAERTLEVALTKTTGTGREPRHARARLLSSAGAVAKARGELREADARWRRAHELAQALGERHLVAGIATNLGATAADRGDLGDALDALQSAAAALLRLGRARDAARTLVNLAGVQLRIGDEALAGHHLALARDTAERLEDAPTHALLALLSLEHRLRRGHVREALDGLDDATLSPEMAHRAAALVAQHDLPRARRLLEEGPFGFGHDHARARVELAANEGQDAAALDAHVRAARASARTWEERLLAELVAFDAADATGRRDLADQAAGAARALLDAAARTLDGPQREHLRAVPAYARAWSARPLEDVGAHDARWRRLVRVSQRVLAEQEEARVAAELLRGAVDLVAADRGFLVERADDGTLEELLREPPGERGAPSRSVLGRALEADAPLCTVDALDDERLQRAGSVHAMALRSVLAVRVPLRGRDVALYLDDRLRPAAFDDRDAALVDDLARLGATAMERAAQLERARERHEALAATRDALASEVERQREQLRHAQAPTLIAASEPMRRVVELVERVGPSDLAVLIEGESGVGKEAVARAVHDAGPRRDAPFVAESCAAIPEGLLESVLFGHVAGAFSGAVAARRGLFELADGGTLFLDEVGEMSPAMQAKLLRVLQEGALRRVGSEALVEVDVRVVGASRRPLRDAVASGGFREDLFYRLAVVTLEVPPLRERPDDVAPLVDYLLARHGRSEVTLEADALQWLQSRRWPGNVRELDNALARALLVCRDERIRRADLELGEGEAAPHDLALRPRLDALETELIETALARTEGNQTQAAKLLGVSRYGLQKKLKRLGIELP